MKKAYKEERRDCVFNIEDSAANVRSHRTAEGLTLLQMAASLGHCPKQESTPEIQLRKRVRLTQSKNSPCKCGSGKKFKKCCMT